MIERVWVEMDHHRAAELNPWTGFVLEAPASDPTGVGADQAVRVYPKELEVLINLIEVLRKHKSHIRNPTKQGDANAGAEAEAAPNPPPP